jgi:subtilase family serine protease
MKNFYAFSVGHFWILLLAVFFQVSALAQAPTTPSSNFSVSNIDGDRFYINYTKGDGARRIIIASTNPVTAVPQDGADYVANSTYGLGNELKPGEFLIFNGSSYYSNTGMWVYGLNHSTTYYFRIYEFNGTDYSTEYLTTEFLEGSGTTLSGPTVQASDITFANITGTGMRVNWTPGDGSGRMLIAREGSAVDVEPEDLKSYYAYSSFGYYYSEIGTGNYVIYSGSGTGVNISNLDPAKTYHFALFEYNGSNGRIYLRPGATGEQLTSSYPTVAASNSNFSNLDGNRFYHYFTAGNGEGRLVIAKKGSAVTSVPTDGISYTTSETFGSGQQLNEGEFVVHNSSWAGHWIYGLEPGTEYHFAVFEYNGSGENIFYLKDPYLASSQSTLTGPTVQASDITFANITGTGMRVNWTPGDGSGRMLIAREGSAVDVEPEDLKSYYAYSSFGYYYSEIGTGNYVIYSGSGTGVNISNLDPAKTYHFALFEYNGSNGRIYLRPGATGEQLTSSYPTVAASNSNFSNLDGNRFYHYFTAGNGEGRLVIAKKGSAVTSVPTDGISYTTSETFGSGQQLNEGEFVVHNSSWAGHWIYGLEPGAEYHFAVFEYNGSGENIFYLKDPYLASSQSTLTGPTVQASDITFANITGTGMRVNWTPGDGSGRMLIAREGSAVDVEPEDLKSYYAYSSFGYYYSEIGTGNYVIYSGSGTGVNISNLDPAKTYHFALFEYNGSNGRIYLRPGATGEQLTSSYPTVAASNSNFSNLDGNRFYHYFTAGNGEGRLVIAKKGSAVTSVPTDGISYTTSETFGSGQQLNEGEFVVHNSSWAGHWIYGLEPGTEYHFAVFEYNGSGENIFYLKDPYLASSQSTLFHPTIQSSNAFLSSRSTTSLNVSWTKGNGSSRILIGRKDGPVNIEPEDLVNYYAYSSYGYYYSQVATSGNYVLYAGSGNNVNVTNLEAGTNYHFALFEYNGNNGKLYLRPGYAFALETFGERPTVQVSNAQFSNVDFSSFDVSMTAGNGSRRLVLAREGGPVSSGPADFTSYLANSAFGEGTEIGTGNFVVYNDFGENFSLSGLNPGKNYHFAFYEYSMSTDGELYMAPAYTASQITLGAPSQIATNFAATAYCTTEPTLTWTAGNGSGRIVVISKEELNTLPVNHSSYSANPAYGTGDALGNGFVVYNGSGETVTVNSLQEFTNYQVNIFEYNGTAESPYFNTTPLKGDLGDQTPPTIDAVAEQTISGDEECRALLADYTSLAIVADDCDANPVVTQLPESGTTITGTTPVTLKVTDAFGNSEETSFNVVVLDEIAPVIVTPEPVTITEDESSNFVLTNPVTSDNCGVVSIIPFVNNEEIDPNTYKFNLGITVVTWVVSDAAGNEATVTQQVEVIAGCATTLTSVHSYPVGVFVSPEQGSSVTEFTFKVNYTDESGSMPATGYPRVELDANGDGDALDPLDLIYVMEEEDIADTDVTDGKIYKITVSGLSALSWRSRIVAENSEGCEISTLFVTKPFVSDNLLDIAIYASDISFSRDNPAIGEPIKIYARIKNTSDFAAENFVVSLYAEDEKLSTQTVPLIAAQGSITLEWEQSFSKSDFVPIKVVIDETNVLDEINELNNFAIRPIIVGDFVLPGGIEITASLNPVQIEPNKQIRITGNAIYYGIEEGVDPDVAGATVKAAITGGKFGQSYTRSDGTFDIYLTVPNTPGIYTISGNITDYTLSAEYGPLSFEVTEPAPMPDLVSSISLNKATILQGEEVSGIATVTNRGNLVAENFVFRYYNCEELIGEETIVSLEPGESLQYPFTVTVNSVTDCFNPRNCPFVAFADAEKQVVESSESNNVSQNNLTVLPAKPDLTPQMTYIPTYLKMAEPLNFNVRVDNIGGIPAGAFSVNVYSDNALIHTENISDLSSCGKTSFNVNYTFPSLNDHVITVKVDEAGLIDEYRETNNTYSKTVKNLVVITEPNLQIGISDLSVLPVLPGEGENFEISANFRNNGTADITSPFDVNFIVTEAGVNRTETLRISENVGVGQVLSRKILTSLATYGNHKLQVELDPLNEIAEKSKADNTATAPLCLDFKPSITGPVWNGGFYRDTQQYLTLILQNMGLFTAENVSVKFYLDNEEIAATTVAKVGPYGKSSGSIGISLPYIFEKDGVFELSVRVDDPDSYTECNEGNNIFSKSIVVKPPLPDLRVISEYISPTELNPDLDEPINIFLSFDNVGIMRSDAFVARVKVDDVQLGQDVAVPALNPGENGTIAIAAPYSSTTGGIRIIRGFVDPDNLIVESNETNNEASRAIIIGDAPNLFFTGLDIDFNCPEDGEEVTLTATIENEGDLGTEADIQFYYIASSDTIPIDRRTISIGANSIVSTGINWTVVNSTYSLYAEIQNSSQPEYDVLDNSIRSEFCTVEMYAVKVGTIGQGIIKKNPDQHKYEVGAEVEIKAVPAQGWYFKNWTGALTGNVNPMILNVDSGKELTAVFEQIPVSEFAVVIDIQGDGTVTRTPEKNTYALNEEIALEATPAEGQVFIEWLGDLNSTNPFETLIMDKNKSVTAVFVEDLNVTHIITNSSCTDLADGKIELTVTGGSIPYTYDWDNDGTGEEDSGPDSKDLENITAGVYTVIITDANGLTKTVIAEVFAEETGRTFYADLDGDGLGDPENSIVACLIPENYVTNNNDCDDTDPEILGVKTWYRDYDEDGFGDNNETILSCTQPDGYVNNNEDCDDTSSEVGPATAWYPDMDDDGYGDINGEPVFACAAPSTGYVSNNLDCNDEDATIFPGAIEIPGDGIDQDCDGVDETALSITAPEDIYLTSCGGQIELGEPVVDGQSAGAIVTNDAPNSYAPGTTIITWTVEDGDQRVTDEQFVIISNDDPVINSIIAPEDPQPITQEILLSAYYSDNNISTVTWNWGDGTTNEGSFSEGIATGTHLYSLPGVYTITLTIVDDCGATSNSEFQYLVIYDPSAGFVTGRGFIYSPPGAYLADLLLEGEANFGFVSKYKKGAKIPDGRTQFEFLAGDFHFESTAYEWLTVAGSKGMFKGEGVVSGQADIYGFLLSAIDDDISGDKFRIKIWVKISEEVIYDNEIGSNETGDPTTLLTRGSIKVHTTKGKNKTTQLKNESEINEIEANNLSITAYPNPMAADGFWINFSSEVGGQTFRARMYDFNGRLLVERTIEVGAGGGAQFWNLDHSGWDQGVYILRLAGSTKEYQVQLMKN